MPSMARRGRPLKFGRPSRSVWLTLPTDVIERLREFDTDVSRAVVSLVTAGGDRGSARTRVVDTIRMGRREALILVDPTVIPPLPGCAFIRIGEGRAFVALEAGAGLADFELAVIDRLADPDLTREQRAGLRTLRGALKKWRRDQRVKVYPRAIVVLSQA